MKEHLGKIVLAVFSLCLIWGLITSEYKCKSKTEETSIYFRVGKEVIQAWKKEGVYYLFLPSYVDKEEISLVSYSAKISLWVNGKDLIKDGKMGEVLEEEVIQGQFLETGENFELCVLQSENLPAIFIETKFGEVSDLKADKELQVSGAIVCVDSEGNRTGKLGLKAIGGRGNTSFAGYEKKPFSITLEKECELAGLPTGRKYALISNASDPSLVRNDLARRMEVALNLPFSRTGQFVDLYINGEYEGNYYLCNEIEIGEQQINIENMEAVMDLFYQKSGYEVEEIYENEAVKARKLEVFPTDITGGYLLEREYGERFRLEYETMGSGFVTDRKEHFAVKSPKYCSIEQIKYISDYVNQTEKAIVSKDGINPDTQKSYEEYLKLDSFVKKYLVEEITKNYDAGVSSSYYYKDSDKNGGKLAAGPGWDYDMSLGNYVEWMEDFSADPTGISELEHHLYASDWYAKLCEKEKFGQAVKADYWEYVEPFLREMLVSGLEEYQNMLENSSNMNHVRWEEELEKNIYYENRKQTFLELKEFIAVRKAYLDETWKIENK